MPAEKPLTPGTRLAGALGLKDVKLGKYATKLLVLVNDYFSNKNHDILFELDKLLEAASKDNAVNTVREKGNGLTLLTFFLSNCVMKFAKQPVLLVSILTSFKEAGDADFYQIDNTGKLPLDYMVDFFMDAEYYKTSHHGVRNLLWKFFAPQSSKGFDIEAICQEEKEGKHFFSKTALSREIKEDAEVSMNGASSRITGKIIKSRISSDKMPPVSSQSHAVEMSEINANKETKSAADTEDMFEPRHNAEQRKRIIKKLFVDSFQRSFEEIVPMVAEVYAILNFSEEDIANLFAEVKRKAISIVDFCFALMIKLKLIDNPVKRKMFLAGFFAAAKETNLDLLYVALVKHAGELDDWNGIINDFIESRKHTPQECLFKLTRLLEKATCDIATEEESLNYVLPAIKTIKYLLAKQRLKTNPFAHIENTPIFFNKLLEIWRDCVTRAWQPAQAKVSAHHFAEEHKNVSRFYQVEMQHENVYAEYGLCIILVDLLPDLNEEDKFLQRCKLIFGTDLTPTEMKELRKELLINQGIPSNIPQTLLAAIRHRLAIDKIEVKNDLPDLISASSRYAPEIYEIRYNDKKKSDELVRITEAADPDEKVIIRLIKLTQNGKTVYQCMIHAPTFLRSVLPDKASYLKEIRRMRLELQYFELIQFVFFNNKMKSVNNYQFTELPTVLMKLDARGFDKVIQLMLGERLSGEEEKVPEPRGAMHKAMLRDFCSRDPSSDAVTEQSRIQLRERFKKITCRLACQDVPYYKLFIQGIRKEFLDSFETPFAKNVIHANCDNSDFQSLYLASEERPSEFNLVRLIDNVALQGELINGKVFSVWRQLQAMIGADTTLEKRVFTLLRSLVLRYDDPKEKLDDYMHILTLVASLFARLLPWDHETDRKVQFLGQFEKALESASYSETIINLSNLEIAVKVDYPCVEDIHSVLDDIPIALYQYLRRMKDLSRINGLITVENKSVVLAILNKINSFAYLDSECMPCLQQIVAALRQAAIPDLLMKTWQRDLPLVTCLLVEAGYADSAPHQFTKTFFSFLAEHPEAVKRREVVLALLSIAQSTPELLNLLECKFEDLISQLSASSLQSLTLSLLKGRHLSMAADVSAFYRQKYSQSIWTNETYKMKFMEAISEILGHICNHVALFDEPNFFTDNIKVIQYFSEPGWQQDELLQKIALRSIVSNHTREEVESYRESYAALREATQNMEKPDNVMVIILEAFLKHAAVFTLMQITSLFKLLSSLRIPKTYPIEAELAAVFGTPAAVTGDSLLDSKEDAPEQEAVSFSTWYSKIDQIFTKIFTFTVAGYPLEQVQKDFEECKPSLNDIIETPPDMTQTPIQYFVAVYKEAKKFILAYGDQPITMALSNYDTINPIQWNFNDDARFFGSMYVVSKLTLGKELYHAQHISMMGWVYAASQANYKIHKEKQVHPLMGIGSGLGKTIVIAHAVVVMNKILGNPEFIPITTNTSTLATSNAAEMKPFYQAYKLSVTDNVYNQKAVVRYTEFERLVFYMGSDLHFTAVHGKEPVKKTVLFSDESDLPYEDFYNVSTSLINFPVNKIVPLLDMIWQDPSQSRDHYLKSKSYLKLAGIEQQYALTFLDTLIANAKKVKEESEEKDSEQNVTSSGEVRFQKETGIVAKNHYSGLGVTFFRQLKQGIKQESYSLCSMALANKDVSEKFPIRMGVSGTLGSPEVLEAYRKKGFFVAMSANFNARKLRCEPTKLCEDSKWYAKLRKIADHHSINNNVPVIIILEHPSEVEHFIKLQYPDKKMNVMKDDLNEKDYQAFLINAVSAGTISIVSIIGARGIDTTVNNAEINKRGGMVIVNGAIQETDRLEDQAKLRTARLDNEGLYLRCYAKTQVKRFLQKAGVSAEDLTQENVDLKISQARKNIFERKNRSAATGRAEPFDVTLTKHFYEILFPAIRANCPSEELNKLLYAFMIIMSKARDTNTHDPSKRVESLREEYNKEICSGSRTQFRLGK